MRMPSIAGLLFGLAASTVVAAQQPKPMSVSRPAASAPLIKPGLWEIVNAIDTAGSGVKRTVTARACYSADDVKSAERIVPLQREAGMKCENRNIKQQSAIVDWQVACTGKEGSRSGAGRLTLTDESFTGQASLEAKGKGKPIKITQSISGKRLGDCK